MRDRQLRLGDRVRISSAIDDGVFDGLTGTVEAWRGYTHVRLDARVVVGHGQTWDILYARKDELSRIGKHVQSGRIAEGR